MSAILLSLMLLDAAAEVQTRETPTTRLFVQTTPPGATIKLDGKAEGAAPKVFLVPPDANKMVVEVELDGHASQRREVTIQGGRVTRIEFQLAPQQAKPDGSRFIGHTRLAAVELLGVTHYRPTVKSQWWRPDGTSAEIGSYLRRERKKVGAHINWGTKEEMFLPKRESDNVLDVRGEKGVTFLIRVWNRASERSSYGGGTYERSTADTSRPISDLPVERPSHNQNGHDGSADEDLQPVYAFKPWDASPEVDHVARAHTGITSQEKNIFSPAWESNTVVDAGGNVVPNHSMFSAVVARPAQAAILRVGVSRGAWETMASQKADRAGSSTFDRNNRQWTVVFDKAQARGANDGTQVNLKTTLSGYEAFNEVIQRLVAVTSDGKEHATKWGEGYWEYGRTMTYDLPLSSITEFRFQVSPYDWVCFENISLQPGQKTEVRVVSPKGS